MNKKYIILTLVLCFSLAFVVYPLSFTHAVYIPPPSARGTVQGPFQSGNIIYYLGYVPASPPTDAVPTEGGWIVTYAYEIQEPYKEEQYSGWFCNPTTESCFFGQKQSPGYGTQEQCQANCIYCRYCRKWGYFFGANGCYGIKKCSNNIDECTTNPQCSGETIITKYICSGAPNYTCSEDSNGSYSSLSTCQNDCVKPPTTITCPGNSNCYKCNTSYQCVKSSTGSYTSLSSCTNKCKEPSTTPTSPSPTSPPPTSPPPTSPPPTCQILEFSLNGKTNEDQDPLIVWVKASLTGYFSVNDTCKTCTVTSDDTWGYSPQTYEITTLNSDYTETFKINASGIYAYTLTCEDADGDEVQDTLSLQTVKALNLPWWREIIPNLGGFLRGL